MVETDLITAELAHKSPIPARHSDRGSNLGSLLLMLLVAVGAHLEFSWMGFSPTDEGWILAYSRRLLAGQVPHRDYLRVQIPGTEFFHAPEVLFGGEYTYWISRFVAWLQIAVIAWAWPIILSKLSGRDLTWQRKSILSLICFAFTACTFPVIVWPTYDGLFFISIGLLLVLRQGSLSKLCGYFLIGLSYVCKQNFIVVFPVVLLVLDDWKRLRYWIAASLPGAAYVGSMLVLGAMPDVLIQVGSATPFVERAVLPVLTRWNVLLGIALGLVSIGFLTRRKPWASVVGLVSVNAVVLLCGLALSTELYWYSNYVSWGLFGFALGAVLAERFFSAGDREAAKAGLVAVVVAWSIAISNGFNFPTLGCGVLALFLMYSVLQDFEKSSGYRYALASNVALMAVCLAAFFVGRNQHIYRDLPASRLTARLDGVLPGGRLLRTNPNTFAFLSDLNVAISETHGERYAIIPGFPAYWVKGQQLDPLPIDWPYVEVLSNPKMPDRLVKSMMDQKGSIILIVEKVEPTNLSTGFERLYDPIYPQTMMYYARTRFDKIGETKYFELRK